MDGKPAPLERWEETFQSVRVPAGEHRLGFEFRSSSLRAGMAISLASLAALVILVFSAPFASLASLRENEVLSRR